MNFAAKFGALPSDSFSSAGFKLDALTGHGGGDSVTIPDAHLLFSGDYSRSGTDLIVSDHLHRVVVPNYFGGDKRPALLSPDGAPLDPSVIEALTGHVQYAQAAGTAAATAAKVVGHVVKITGSCSVVRNGVTVTLNNGDTVLQNDVVQTGSNSSLGLVMIDGTTFNLNASARLMLNDLTYDAASTSNSSLFTLVQGAASFVAGQVAKTGDMKVGTPVATMGIRGTAVILDINATDGKVSISVIDQRDGQVHSVQVYNNRGVLIGTVTSNGTALTLTPLANFEVLAQESNKTVAQIAQEWNAYREALALYEIQKAIDPNLPQHTENNVNPRQYASLGSSSSSSPQTEYHSPASGGSTPPSSGGTPTDIVFYPPPGTPPGGSSATPSDPGGPVSIPLQVVVQPAQLPFVVNPSTVPQISADPGDHFGPVMSASGDVVYDPDGVIFFYDRETNTTIRVTPENDGFSYSGQTISSDGRFLVYQGTDGESTFVYLFGTDPSDPEHYHQQIQLVAGTSPAISGDGSRILVEHGGASIGIYNLQGELQGSITAAAAGATGTVWKPAISADGHAIAFWTSDGPAAGGAGHLFAYDVTTGEITEIASTATGAGTSAASFSADGRYVTYQSTAPGGHSEIYLYDFDTGQVIFHTQNTLGASYSPVISPDGHFIVFASHAKLTSGDTNAFADIYTVDVTNPNNPIYKLISVRPDGTVGDADSNLGAAISAGGKFVAFGSKASNFSSDADGGAGDIFLSDPSSGRNAIIYETANSPDTLHAQGVIQLTGDRSSSISITVSDNTGRFTAGFDANGNIVWQFNEAKSDFDSLPYGQAFSQQFVITLTAGGQTITIPVNVTVHNGVQPEVVVANVAPGAAPVTLADGVEDQSVIISAATLLAAVGDIDSPLSALSITGLSIASGGGSLYANEDGTWTYVPAADFNGTVIFNYTVSDGSKSATSTATLDIGGFNDEASISGTATGAVEEDGCSTTASGTLTVHDVDAGENHFQTVDPEDLVGTYGDFAFDEQTGVWTYTLDPIRANGLGEGDIVCDTLTVTSADGSATQNIDVVIHGTNDAPEFIGQGQVTYVVGGEGVAIASEVFADDVDSDDYDGGSFTAEVTAGAAAGDRLLIAENEFISLVEVGSGHIVMYDADGDGDTSDAVAIGELGYNYYYNNGRVSVDLNGNATDAAVEALAQAIQFENGKSNAETGTRNVTFTLQDGDGDSDQFETTVDVESASNQDPVANNDVLPAAPPTGDGWVLNSANGHYYRLVASDASWHAANSYAHDDGAYLATITSQSEQNFVHNLSGGLGAWLGGFSSDASDPAAWSWTDGPEYGHAFNYTNWNFGEPNGSEFSSPQGLHLGSDGKWNDLPLDETNYYVEEWGGRASDANVTANSTLSIYASNLLANDTDPDSGNQPTFRSVSAYSALGAELDFSASGSIISYDPTQSENLRALAAGEVITDSFTYEIDDGHGGTDTATVTLLVAGVNDAPELTAEVTEADYVAGAGAVAVAIGVSASDIDGANFGGGSLRAEVTYNFHDGDKLSIDDYDGISTRSAGSGTAVMYDSDGEGGEEAVQIGTLWGWGGSLSVYLNSNASDAAVAALTQAIRFETSDQTDGDRTVSITLEDGDGEDNGGSDSTQIDTVVHVTAGGSGNTAPIAGDDSVTVRADYAAIASSLHYNDSDSDPGDSFHISAVAHGADQATDEDGFFTIQGQYGTLRVFYVDIPSVTLGGFENFHVHPGDYIYTIGQDPTGLPVDAYEALHDLPLGEHLTDTFTYTITDSHQLSATATITVTFDAAAANVYVQTPDGYDMTTLAGDIQLGNFVSISETEIVLSHEGRTITVEAKGLVFEQTDDGYALLGGLIKGFHVTDSNGAGLLEAMSYSIPAALFDGAVHDNPAAVEAMLQAYAYQISGGEGADVLTGGVQEDYIDTMGGADVVHAGGDDDVILVRDDSGWHVDGGSGADIVRFVGNIHTATGPRSSTVSHVEIIDLNTTHSDSIQISGLGASQMNGGGPVRILGNDVDAVNFNNSFDGHPYGSWVLTEGGPQLLPDIGDGLTHGVWFNRFTYIDGGDTLATVYVQNGIVVNVQEPPPQNEAPVAHADNIIAAASAFVISGDQATLSLDDGLLLANDTDGNGDTLFVDSAGYGSPAYGTASQSNSGVTDYTLTSAYGLPTGDEPLVDSFSYTATDLSSSSNAGTVNLTVVATDGGDALSSTLIDTSANNILIGGLLGDSGTDTFVFAESSGHDTVVNFHAGEDLIELLDDNPFIAGDEASFNNWLTASGQVTEQGESTLIMLGDDSILLSNVSRASLQMSDFILHPGGSSI